MNRNQLYAGDEKDKNTTIETAVVLTTNPREKGQKHVNKTAAAVEAVETVACREKSSEQQLFLPFSALYINVCIKTPSSLSAATKVL